MMTTAYRDLDSVRARMAAWDRSFELGHGRRPDEREWANAARAIGHLPMSEADALARATYNAFGEAASIAPVQQEYTAFAEAVMARRRRRAARAGDAVRRAESRGSGLGGSAGPVFLAGIALAVWAARRGRRPAA